MRRVTFSYYIDTTSLCMRWRRITLEVGSALHCNVVFNAFVIAMIFH